MSLLCVILLQECQKRELKVELPYDGDKLVIFSELNPDRVVSLYLNQTYPPTGKFTVKKGLSGAEVDLLENGIFKERLTYADSGVYVSKMGLKPKTSQSYSFKVKLKGYLDADTQPVEIPQSVLNPEVVLGKDTIPSVYISKAARKLELEWIDNENGKNNYIVIIEGKYQNQDLGTSSFRIGKDSEVEDGCSFSRNRNRYVFQDVCFPNQKLKTSFGLDTFGALQNLPTSYTGSRLRDADAYKVSIANISESYFRWLQDELQPEGVFLAFQTPQNRFSNVNNGYGIVIASNTTTFWLSAK
ncbi:MAG: DUF4249 family protein [Spirosomataceae bacterium]